jgi:hypothetical protein
MRFYEFVLPLDEIETEPIDKFILALKNYIGTAAIKKQPAEFNWNGFAKMMRSQGFEMAADYEVFKSIYDQLPPDMQNLVLDFNDKTVQLNVPGIKNDNPDLEPEQDSQNAVNQMAQGLAPQQLAKQSQTPQVTQA